MNIAFTVCSNNYLAQAKTLSDSVRRHSKDWHFLICLCDEKSMDINYDSIGCDIIEIKNIGLTDIDSLWKKYNIVELNTAVKATFFKFLKRNYREASFIYYFDPDIQILSDLEILSNEFTDDADILLTPHILQPVTLDNRSPGENMFLNNGIYNLGFLGVRSNSGITDTILDWWEERILSIGYDRVHVGLFVDQLWFNLVPVYFDRIKILRKMGYNVAPWNLHERINMKRNDINSSEYIMPDGTPLVFYHFSNFFYYSSNIITPKYNRISMTDSAILTEFYQNYTNNLINNGIEKYSAVECSFMQKKVNYLNENNNNKSEVRVFLSKVGKYWLPPVFYRLLTRILRRSNN